MIADVTLAAKATTTAAAMATATTINLEVPVASNEVCGFHGSLSTMIGNVPFHKQLSVAKKAESSLSPAYPNRVNENQTGNPPLLWLKT